MKVEWREIDCNYYCAKPTRHFILTAREIADGQTVGSAMRPQIEVAYKTGKMPPLLGFEA